MNTPQRARILAVLCTPVLLFAAPAARAELVAAYHFDDGAVPENVITGTRGNLWAVVSSVSDSPHGDDSGRSIELGNVNEHGVAHLPEEQAVGGEKFEGFSVTFWLKPSPEAVLDGGTVLSLFDDDWGVRLGIAKGGALAWFLSDESKGVSESPLKPEVWSHVALVFEPTTQGSLHGTARLYVDGKLDSEIPAVLTKAVEQGKSGRLGSLNPQGLEGVEDDRTRGIRVDDLRVYSTAISEDSVRKDQKAPVTAP